MNQKILVVDDEPHILELISFNLKKNGFAVITAEDGEQALRLIREDTPDLVVLDLMLPGMDGLDVCKTLRGDPATKRLPVIMLTAKGEEVDRIVGLEMGADDYVTKPFSPRELTARIKAVLRRSATEAPSADTKIEAGPLVLFPDRYELTVGGKRQDVTRKEFELLHFLIVNRGRVYTREKLLEEVWGYDFLGDTRTVDVHIRHLRQKIEEDPANPKWLETVRGVGYKFRSEDVPL